MDSAIGYIARSPDACWRVFTDAALMTAWVPGLRRVRVISVEPGGLPHEIQCEFAESLSYSLLYTYDLQAREVRWEPRVGKRDAVSGFARFEPFDAGTRITYGLAPGDARTARTAGGVGGGGGGSPVGPEARSADGTRGDAQTLVDAFTRWMLDERR